VPQERTKEYKGGRGTKIDGIECAYFLYGPYDCTEYETLSNNFIFPNVIAINI